MSLLSNSRVTFCLRLLRLLRRALPRIRIRSSIRSSDNVRAIQMPYIAACRQVAMHAYSALARPQRGSGLRGANFSVHQMLLLNQTDQTLWYLKMNVLIMCIDNNFFRNADHLGAAI